MYHAGVDVIVNNDQVEVIEINATADIGMHVFPLEGEARNVPEAIIDDYFPESQVLALERIKVYFDYRKVNEMLQSMFTQEIMITNATQGKLYANRYIISGKV